MSSLNYINLFAQYFRSDHTLIYYEKENVKSECRINFKKSQRGKRDEMRKRKMWNWSAEVTVKEGREKWWDEVVILKEGGEIGWEKRLKSSKARDENRKLAHICLVFGFHITSRHSVKQFITLAMVLDFLVAFCQTVHCSGHEFIFFKAFSQRSHCSVNETTFLWVIPLTVQVPSLCTFLRSILTS